MSDTSTEQELVPVKKPGTDDVIMVTPEVKDLMNDQISLARKDATTKAENKFKPTKELLAQYEKENGIKSEELETLKESQMTETEKIQNQYKKDLKKHQDTAETAAKDSEYWKGKYTNNKIDTDIYGAFAGYKLSNQEHAKVLFKNSVETDIQPIMDADGNPTGSFTTKMKMIISDGNGGYQEKEGSPSELFKMWIEQDSNKHLLLSSLAPGAGSTQGGTLETLSGIDKLRAQYAEAKAKGDGVGMMHLKEQISKATAAASG